MTSLIGHQHQWIPLGQEDISQVGAIVKSTFLFLRPSWYGIHIIVGKSLRVTISKTFGKQNFLALPGFDQKLQLRYLWYCDTRPQWQAFKKIFDVNASLFGSSLCIFEMNCLVMFWSGGPPEQTGDKSHKTTMSGSQESFRVPASHFRAGKTPKDNI